MPTAKARCIGILTSGGDCPGLNAAIRGVAKPAMSDFHIEVIGIEKGFRGLVENHSRVLHLQRRLRHPVAGRHHPRHQPREAAQDAAAQRRNRRPDAARRRDLQPPRPRLPGLPGRQRHAQGRLQPDASTASTSSACPRPSTTTWSRPTSPSATTRPSPPRPRRSTGSTRRPRRTCASWSSS